MKDLEQLKQLILADLEKESKQRIEVATKEQEERINQMNAQYSQQEMAKKTALKQEAKSQYEKEQQTILNASKKEVLRVKRELLESVFEDVLQVMSTGVGKHYVSLSSQLFANYQNNNKQHLLLERKLFLV